VTGQGKSGAAGFVALAAALLLGLPAGEACAGEAARFEWREVPRVVAVGDTHGSYLETRALLLELRLIDTEDAWIGGKAHLVFLGDLLDRGRDERALLDMVRRLQPAAESAGGRVHVLLGNHEAMNLVGDLRYVTPQGFLDFADFAAPGDRDAAWTSYHRSMRGAALTKEELRQAFDEAHPPGYFGRMRALGPGGEYGEWLLDQQAILKINDVVFVHAGLTEAIAALGLDETNRRVVSDIRDFAEQRALLEEEDAVLPFATFTEVMRAAGALAADPTIGGNGRARTAALGLREFLDSIAVLPDGPLWYRGNSLEDERIERERVEQCLALLDARAMAVGHTMTRSGGIQSRFDGSIFRTDVGLYKRGRPQALVFEDGDARVFDAASGELVAAAAEPPQGEGTRPAYPELSDLHIERVLETGKVRSIRPLGRGGTRPLLLELTDGDYEMRGLFKYVERKIQTQRADGTLLERDDRFQHEIAAYRLDRMLQLGMVPVTVARSLKGSGPGSVQLWIEGAVQESAEQFEPLPEPSLARVPLLRERARVFDALIGNADREAEDYLHQLEEGWLYLVDHSSAFATSTNLASFLQDAGCSLDREMERALRSLSRREIRSQLGPWLDAVQIRALFERRDRLLKICEHPEKNLQPL